MQTGIRTERITKTKFKESRYLHQRSEGLTKRDSTFTRKYRATSHKER